MDKTEKLIDWEDKWRWELDPASSEDYQSRVRDEGGLDGDKEERR